MPRYQIEPLHHQERRFFSCGEPLLDHYLKTQASQDIKRYLGATFLLIEIETQQVAGYYTLSATGIPRNDFPEEITKKFPQYKILPATLLGRLAIDKHYQKQNLGELLLIDALKRSYTASLQIASIGVVVDAKHQKAADFYKKYGLLLFPDIKNKLFISMKKIKELLFSQ